MRCDTEKRAKKTFGKRNEIVMQLYCFLRINFVLKMPPLRLVQTNRCIPPKPAMRNVCAFEHESIVGVNEHMRWHRITAPKAHHLWWWWWWWNKSMLHGSSCEYAVTTYRHPNDTWVCFSCVRTNDLRVGNDYSQLWQIQRANYHYLALVTAARREKITVAALHCTEWLHLARSHQHRIICIPLVVWAAVVAWTVPRNHRMSGLPWRQSCSSKHSWFWVIFKQHWVPAIAQCAFETPLIGWENTCLHTLCD